MARSVRPRPLFNWLLKAINKLLSRRSQEHALTQLEASVRRALADELVDYSALLGRVYNAITHGLVLFGKHDNPPPVAKLQALILARILADLRVCQWTATGGYVFQAITLASVLHEVSYGLIYLGKSDDRAKEWIEHDNLKKTYPECGHRQTIKEVRKYFPELTDQHLETEYAVYQQMCLAKHGNPQLQRQYGALEKEGMIEIQHPPYYSERTVFYARYALLHASRAAATALHVYTMLHLEPLADADFVTQLAQIGPEMRALGDRHGLMGAYE